LDFKEDQLALEAYIRMRSNWRDEDEISEEQWLEYAIDYMEENPFPDMVVKSDREALVCDRLTGETTYWKRIPHTELYWEPGEFWRGMWLSIRVAFSRMGIELPYFYFPSLRGLAMYFGLIDDPEASSEDE
jgi:hypothetical protein